MPYCEVCRCADRNTPADPACTIVTGDNRSQVDTRTAHPLCRSCFDKVRAPELRTRPIFDAKRS